MGISPHKRPGREDGKRQVRRRERIATLERAALDGFLAHGLEATTVAWIVERSRCGKNSFYRYFPSKTAMVEALMEPLSVALSAAYERCDDELAESTSKAEIFGAYERLGLGLGQIVIQHPDAVRLYLQEARGPDTGCRRPVRALGRIIERGAMVLTATARAHGLIRPFPNEVSALAVIGATERLIYAVLDGDPSVDPVALPGQLIALVLEGLTPTKSS